jgi:hypothetical protein
MQTRLLLPNESDPSVFLVFQINADESVHVVLLSIPRLRQPIIASPDTSRNYAGDEIDAENL